MWISKNIRTFSWTQIWDKDLYSDTDSAKHNFELRNRTLKDYEQP